MGGPDEAAQHYQQALELLADPRRRRDVDLDVARLAVDTADALVASGHPDRAAAVLAEQLAQLPADAPDTWRARILAARASALTVIETDEDPAELSGRALALVPEDAPGLRAQVAGDHARTLAALGRFEEAQAVGLDALYLAEKLDLHAVASDAMTTLGGLQKSGPKAALRAALVDAVRRAEDSGAVEAQLRGRFMLGRSYEDWAEFDEAERWFRSGLALGERAGVAVGAVRAGGPLAARLGAAGAWALGRGARPLRRPAPAGADRGRRAAGGAAGEHRGRPRGRRQRGPRGPAPALAAGGRDRHPRGGRRRSAWPGSAASRRRPWRRTTTRSPC